VHYSRLLPFAVARIFVRLLLSGSCPSQY